MYEIYVIVVFETVIAIFNSTNGQFLEERGHLDRFKYKCACLNHQTGDVYLVALNNSTAKNIINTKIYQLKEIPAQDQIDYLLSAGRISEANEIFNLKGNKGGGDFSKKQSQFYLDVGWIRLTKMLDFNHLFNDFRNTEVDPRELVLLYKSLVVHNPEAIKKHYTQAQFDFDL